MKDCSLQLGSLCKGLMKVGGHLERTNPSALSRLQVAIILVNGVLWNRDAVRVLLPSYISSGPVDQSLPRLQPGHCFETAAVGGLLCLYGLQR